ncbi:MAG TPA: protein kinase [Allosphingosinicella sp.]
MSDPTLERDAVRLFEQWLDVPEQEREDWLASATAGQPELLARLQSLIDADRRASLRTGAATSALEDEAPPPERIGAYRIVELIGRGGMGSVYRGERVAGDFTHDVAIKIVKPGLLSEALIERFQRERQLLARLSHPNIARLYDGGETESGSPYIVMELVQGLPLLRWVEEQQPSRHVRCRLFAHICDAVAFAHRHLIVHRDLTPSNVLVTADSAVKLIDFGIARPADAAEGDGEAVSVGSLSLTPGYAAPERMTSSNVSTAADIYSLGRVLEKLIPPAPGDRELKAIIGKAAALDPADRYPTADALRDEVHAWQRGLPVGAYARGRRYWARKFMSRHRWPVTAAAVVLLMLVGALTVAVIANARAQEARTEAERRFQQTRGIAKAMLFEAFDQVSRVPGSTRARAILARTGLAYLEALAADGNAPLDVRIEAGNGFIRLAKVAGDGEAGQLGRYRDANALLARAEAILTDLARRHPDDPAVRQAMAGLLLEQAATSLYNDNEIARAREQAIRAQRMLAGIEVANIDAARIYATAVQGEADSYGWDENYPRARATHLRALQFLDRLPAQMREQRPILMVRSAVLRLLGEAHHNLDQQADARRVLDEAVAINRRLVRAEPDDPALVRKLATSLWYRAVVHRTNGRDELARASIEEAVANARQLRDRDRNDAGGLHLFAITGEVQAQVLADLRHLRESYAVGAEVIAAHRRLVELAEGAPGAVRSMADAISTQGGNFYNGGDYARACAAWREAHGIYASLEARGSLSESHRASRSRLGDYLARSCDNGPPRPGLGDEV